MNKSAILLIFINLKNLNIIIKHICSCKSKQKKMVRFYILKNKYILIDILWDIIFSYLLHILTFFIQIKNTKIHFFYSDVIMKIIHKIQKNKQAYSLFDGMLFLATIVKYEEKISY